MDLIYANESGEDVGVMKDYTFDLAFGTDENDFECTINRKNHCCGGGFFLYIEGTEYGGVIDDIKTDTEKNEITYHGRTWHGYLESKSILPLQPGEKSTSKVTLQLADAGGDSYVDKYLIVSGEANAVIAWILERIGLSSLFNASSENSTVMISNFQFDRYCLGYSGISKMLKTAGAKMKVSFIGGKVVVSAENITDYSKDEQFDSDLLGMIIKKCYNPVNHLICLGKGELSEREVIHLYADASGNISRTQSIIGIHEVVALYDYSHAESTEELERSGIEKMQELRNNDFLLTDFVSDSNSFDIGDIVGAVDRETGMEGKAKITKKIVIIKNNSTTISYEVGE